MDAAHRTKTSKDCPSAGWPRWRAIPFRCAPTSMEFLPGCSATSSWSPSLCSLLILSSLASRFRLMKFYSVGQSRSQCPTWPPSAHSRAPCLPWVVLLSPNAHLILAPAAGVVKVAVAPVILHAALGLLVQPVQLIGAALHVVLQGAQVLLPCL